MRIRFTPAVALPAFGLLALGLSGCQSEATKFDAPAASSTAAPAATTSPTAGASAPAGAADPIPGLPPVVESPSIDPNSASPLTPVAESVDHAASAAQDAVGRAGQAVDDGVRRASQHVRETEDAIRNVVPPAPPETEPEEAPSIIPEVVAPVVDAAKGQVNEAVGEIGRGARQVAEGVTEGVRQTADEVTQGAVEKANGIKQSFRQAADDLSQKAKATTHKATSDLLKKIQQGARETIEQGAGKAADAAKDVKEAVKPPAPAR